MIQFVFKELWCVLQTCLAKQSHDRGKTNKMTSVLLAI